MEEPESAERSGPPVRRPSDSLRAASGHRRVPGARGVAYSSVVEEGVRRILINCTNCSALKVRFSATVGEGPEVEVALV